MAGKRTVQQCSACMMTVPGPGDIMKMHGLQSKEGFDSIGSLFAYLFSFSTTMRLDLT